MEEESWWRGWRLVIDLPLADDEAQGGAETFAAKAFFLGQAPDRHVVGRLEVDDALDVVGGHEGASPCVGCNQFCIFFLYAIVYVPSAIIV